MQNSAVRIVTELLKQADVIINGPRPWDIQVKNERAFGRAIYGGIIGIGDSFVDGDWDCPAVDELVTRVYRAGLAEHMRRYPLWVAHWLIGYLINAGTRARSRYLARQHYNLGNDLFRAMLDKTMAYTCAYWKGTESLEQAQKQKFDLVCRKVRLKPGMKVLDIGGGWGSFAKYAAENYGVSVVNISVSKEQIELADQLCKGLPVENRLIDYREVTGQFDAIVSLGMFEHVGYKNYQTYMDVARRCLKNDGLFLLHTIGGNVTTNHANPWIEKYVFLGMIPSLKQITEAVEKRFVVEDIHNFGANYDKTLMAWWHNFDRNWSELKNQYGDRFYRVWKMYLQSCAGSFRSRNLQLWQIVLSPHGVDGGYESIR